MSRKPLQDTTAQHYANVASLRLDEIIIIRAENAQLKAENVVLKKLIQKIAKEIIRYTKEELL